MTNIAPQIHRFNRTGPWRNLARLIQDESMQPYPATETHRTPEVKPAITQTVPWRVKSVTALPDARLQVVFVDGTAGEVHMKQFLSSSKLYGTLFDPLRDPAIFALRGLRP